MGKKYKLGFNGALKNDMLENTSNTVDVHSHMNKEYSIAIRFPKEVMSKFFGTNKEYRIECRAGKCPICAWQVGRMDRWFDFDALAKVREIAIGKAPFARLKI